MLSKEIGNLERENYELKKALQELSMKMEQNTVIKPKSCQYCMYYIQHYIKDGIGSPSGYTAIHDGHCVSRVPVKDGGKRRPKPDDTCPYFKLGTKEIRFYER